MKESFINELKSLREKLFTGETKYTIGLIFIFANVSAYFLNMRKIKIEDKYSVFILLVFIFIGKHIV